MSYVEILKNHCNAVDGTFYGAIKCLAVLHIRLFGTA